MKCYVVMRCGVLCCGTVWRGVVWCVMLRCGAVWCVMLWCGVVWCCWSPGREYAAYPQPRSKTQPVPYDDHLQAYDNHIESTLANEHHPSAVNCKLEPGRRLGSRGAGGSGSSSTSGVYLVLGSYGDSRFLGAATWSGCRRRLISMRVQTGVVRVRAPRGAQ